MKRMERPEKFEDFIVWQQARELVGLIYAQTRSGDFAKDYGLKDQIQRAAVSIPSNIAEGYERNSNRELLRFLYIAKGSAGEVRSQLYTALDLKYLAQDVCEDLMMRVKRISAGLFKWIRSVQQSGFNGVRYNPFDEPAHANPLTLATLEPLSP